MVAFADERGISKPTFRLMIGLALFLKTKAQYAEAEVIYRRALAISERTFGIEDYRVATALNNLAQLLLVTNRDACGNYIGFLRKMNLSEGEIHIRFAEVGIEAGFDAESLLKLAAQLGAD